MQPFAYLIKVSLPNYLAGLPIPDSIGGWFRLGCEYPVRRRADFEVMSVLSVRDILSLVPPTAALAGFTYVTYRAFCPHGRPAPSGAINPKIRKDVAKVVDTVDVEDITEKAVFCRCWRTKNVGFIFFNLRFA